MGLTHTRTSMSIKIDSTVSTFPVYFWNEGGTDLYVTLEPDGDGKTFTDKDWDADVVFDPDYQHVLSANMSGGLEVDLDVSDAKDYFRFLIWDENYTTVLDGALFTASFYEADTGPYDKIQPYEYVWAYDSSSSTMQISPAKQTVDVKNDTDDTIYYSIEGDQNGDLFTDKNWKTNKVTSGDVQGSVKGGSSASATLPTDALDYYRFFLWDSSSYKTPISGALFDAGFLGDTSETDPDDEYQSGNVTYDWKFEPSSSAKSVSFQESSRRGRRGGKGRSGVSWWVWALVALFFAIVAGTVGVYYYRHRAGISQIYI